MMDDDFDGNAGMRRGGRAASTVCCAITEDRLRRALPLLLPGVAGVTAGGLIAASVAHAPTSALVWLAAYLVLVVGVGQVALAIGQALLVEPVVGNGLIRIECVLFNLGSAGVVGGTLGSRFLLVALGTAIFLGALVAFLLAVRRARAGYAVRLYQGLIGILATGAFIGLILSGLGSNP